MNQEEIGEALMARPVIFIAYSHKDEEEKDRLLVHLGFFQREGWIALWSDDRLGAGVGWQQEMGEAIAQARVVILFISANFLTSDFIRGKEAPALLHQRISEGLIILPVIAKACAWQEVAWLTRMGARPGDGRPIWSGSRRRVDKELAALTREVSRIVVGEPSSLSKGGLDSVEVLRIDAATPDKVAVGLAFSLAVAIRQLASPTLAEADLQVVKSGNVRVRWWLWFRASISLKIQLDAPDCEIHGEASHTFRLHKGQDSPVFYFHLTPRRQGKVDIIVKVYQKNEWLGSARIHTLAYEQVAGSVQLQIESQPLSDQVTHNSDRLSRNAAANLNAPLETKVGLRRLMVEHQRRLQKLREQQARKGIETDPSVLIEIEDIEAQLKSLQAQLQRLEDQDQQC